MCVLWDGSNDKGGWIYIHIYTEEASIINGSAAIEGMFQVELSHCAEIVSCMCCGRL